MEPRQRPPRATTDAPALVSMNARGSSWPLAIPSLRLTTGPSTGRVGGRPPSTLEVEQCLARLGLAERAWGPAEDVWVGGAAQLAQQELVATLRDGVSTRCNEMTSTPRQRSALNAFVDFVAATGRVPFLDPRREGGKEYNQETLELFLVYLRLRGSRMRGARAGTAIDEATISTTVSQVRLAVERRQRRAIVDPDDTRVMAQLGRHMRRSDVPKGQRKLSRGVRAHHFAALAAMGYDRSSARGMTRWAAALTAHNLLLRGGELGTTDKKPFDPRRGLTLGDLDPRDPCAESRWRPWLVLWLVGGKDPSFRHRLVAMPITRRATWEEQPTLGGDPLDAYDALLLHHRRRVAEADPAGWKDAPLFLNERGEVWRTCDSRQLAEEMGSALGIPAVELGGKCWRIGGATDLRKALGDGSQHLIRQRGRWASDVAAVYQRALVDSHLHMSAAIGSVEPARDMEEMFKGWAQPATFR